MSGWNRLLVWLGFRMEPVPDPMVDPIPQPGNFSPANVTPISLYRDFKAPMPAGAAPQGGVGAIHSVKPRTYNDARLIGEAYRKGIPVIMNLSEMSDAEAKRLIDFSAGLSFGLEGSIEKVTPAVFVLTPASIQVATESETSMSERSFYNQS